MGRRSITGTKAGKFMNPTDQARKEARRKELKKNKKQRLQVRQAVIKQKDPKHIFAEMESIDKMEYDPNNPPPYSVKVLQDKRRKLKETWLKIYQFYQREDPKQAAEIKVMERDYESRRNQMMSVYESIMQAQQVKLDDIPLPEFCMPTEPASIEKLSEISAPYDLSAPRSILKSTKPQLVSSAYDALEKQPPGPPPGPPPSLSEFECDNDEFELGLTIEEAYKSNEKPKKIRFDQDMGMQPHQPIPQIVGQLQPPPPPPITAATIQQSLISKSYSSMNRAVPPPPIQGYPPRQQPTQKSGQPYYQQGKAGQPHQAEAAKQTTFQAQPVLRNKVAEITRFVPTALSVKRDTKKTVSASYQTQSMVPSQVNASQSGGPYNYMLQQQQQYATLNPLNSYKSALTSTNQPQSTKPLISSLSKPAHISTSQSISIIAAPSVPSKDAAYEKFMKEMEGLL